MAARLLRQIYQQFSHGARAAHPGIDFELLMVGIDKAVGLLSGGLRPLPGFDAHVAKQVLLSFERQGEPGFNLHTFVAQRVDGFFPVRGDEFRPVVDALGRFRLEFD